MRRPLHCRRAIAAAAPASKAHVLPCQAGRFCLACWLLPFGPANLQRRNLAEVARPDNELKLVGCVPILTSAPAAT